MRPDTHAGNHHPQADLKVRFGRLDLPKPAFQQNSPEITHICTSPPILHD